MKLRIKSKGHRWDTIVTDENGNVLEDVKAVTWRIDADDNRLAVAIIEVYEVEVDLEADAEVS